MSWLRNSSLTSSFSSKRSADTLPKNCDPEACAETFKRHWQQAREIIERTHPPKCYPMHDDVLGVVNNFGQMGTLLMVELENPRPNSPPSPSPCLEHLLSESILNRVFEWSQHTGRFCLMVSQEQMKMYERLVSRAGQNLLVHEPFVKPLLRLLKSCTGNTFSQDQEKQLIMLLRQLCVALTHNTQLLDIFFDSSSTNEPSFIPLTLLIPYVHRSGAVGQQARDALMLCMSLSHKHDALGAFIADHSHVCPILATILSGLFSEVPRKLKVDSEDWHRLTTDDVNELDDLTLFVNTLECCNAIVQGAHKLVGDQLIELITNGFLIPVMGTALLQDTAAINWPNPLPGGSGSHSPNVNSVEELIAATAYYDLFLRTTTAQGIQPVLCEFLLKDCYDDKRILNILLERIQSHAQPKLRIVTLALLETLLGLDSEAVMSELVLKYLTPCSHVMLSQRARLNDYQAFAPTAAKFLALTPLSSVTSATNQPQSLPVVTPQGNQVYGLRPEESLYGNFHAYLCDARGRIEACVRSCSAWHYPYDGDSPPPPVDEELAKSLGGESSGYESLVVRNGDCSSPVAEPKLKCACKPEKCDKKCTSPIQMKGKSEAGSSSSSESQSPPQRLAADAEEISNRLAAVTHVDSGDLGPFIDSLFGLVELMPKLSLQENLRISAIISRLAVYPQPLITSLLLNHSLVFQPSIRTFFQVLRVVKESLESTLSKSAGAEDIIARARQYLLQREEKIASIRKSAVETSSLRKSADAFSRGDRTRRSFSSAISSVFRMAMPTPEQLVENDSPGSGYKYVRGRAGSGVEVGHWNAALCAVVVDEWLKELAAIALEQMIVAAGR